MTRRATPSHASPERLLLSVLAIFFTACPKTSEAQRPPVTAGPAELEIHDIDTRAEFEAGEDIEFIVGVRNKGGEAADFRYALGPRDRSAAWAVSAGTRLEGGDRHTAVLRISYQRFLELLRPYPEREGPRKACFAIFLLRATDRQWSDGNDSDHRVTRCVTVHVPPL